MTDRKPRSPWQFWRSAREADPASHSDTHLPRGDETILFVDDDAKLRDAAEALFHALGYRITLCDSGPAALAALQAAPGGFALLMTDLVMPGMNGIALARAVKALHPTLPIILCTGHPREVGVHGAQDAGITDFYVKPLATDSVARLVRRVLGDETTND